MVGTLESGADIFKHIKCFRRHQKPEWKGEAPFLGLGDPHCSKNHSSISGASSRKSMVR